MVKEAVEFIFNICFLSENLCSLCGKKFKPILQGYICDECIRNLRKADVPVKPIKYVKHYRIYGRYGEGWGEIIRLFKFKRVMPLADIIARKIKYDFEEYLDFVKPEVITFVPVHLLRYWARGMDHNEEILKRTGVEFEDLLVRVRWRKPLVFFDKKKRREIIRNSFSLRKNPDCVRILIFDDVITTGATARTVSELLYSAGVKEIYWYFVAG